MVKKERAETLSFKLTLKRQKVSGTKYSFVTVFSKTHKYNEGQT